MECVWRDGSDPIGARLEKNTKIIFFFKKVLIQGLKDHHVTSKVTTTVMHCWNFCLERTQFEARLAASINDAKLISVS